MTTQALLLTNDYHNTRHTLRVKPHAQGWLITPSQQARAWKALCGLSRCECSGVLGDRGPKAYEEVTRYRDGEIVVRMV